MQLIRASKKKHRQIRTNASMLYIKIDKENRSIEGRTDTSDGPLERQYLLYTTPALSSKVRGFPSHQEPNNQTKQAEY